MAQRRVQDAVVKLARQHTGTVQRFAPQALTQALQGQPINGALGGDANLAGEVEPGMYSTIEDLAKREVTCMSLKVLHALGKDPEPAHRLANAQFLHKELPVRLSQRAVELMNLPHGLSDVPAIQQVYNCCARYAWELFCAPLPSNAQEEYEYSCLLSSILLDGQSIPRALSIGIQDFHNKHAIEDGDHEGSGARLMDVDASVRADIQDAISRFYTGRIGVRFLIEHHVSTMPPVMHRPGWSGVIKSAVSPSGEARQATEAVRAQCMRHLGAAPEVRIFGKESATFTYVPSHLEVMLTEQLKNACRAVVERHHPAYSAMAAMAGPIPTWGGKECACVVKQALAAQRWADGGPGMPPIKVTVAMGNNDVTIKIADEGGGASRSEMDKLWTYHYTTANKHLAGSPTIVPPAASEGQYELNGGNAALAGTPAGGGGPEHLSPQLAGFGVGLPLSREYARYFGGDVLLKSMEGFGMDSYLHLNRLGYDCEKLPPLVRRACV